MLKYQLAEQKILEMMSQLGPGKALPPVRQLISGCGFSQATVMTAVANLEKKGMVRRVRGAGIFAAHSHIHSVGAVAVMMSTLDNSTSSQILQGIQNALIRRGNQILLLSASESTQRVLPELVGGGIRQLILCPNTADLKNPDFMSFTEQLGRSEIDIAVIEIPVPGLKCVFVGQENTHAFDEVTTRLLRQGVRSIAVTGKFNGVIYTSRLMGIRNAINRYGCTVRLRQIDESGGESTPTVAEMLLDTGCEAVMLCNSDSSRDIAQEMRIRGGGRLNKMHIAGVVEQERRIPIPGAISLEKQSLKLGAAAVDALFGRGGKVKYLPMTIHYGEEE